MPPAPPTHTVLARLQALPGALASATSCSSADMTACLSGFSPAEADEVLLLCKVAPESGVVDFARLRDEVALDMQSGQHRKHALPQQELVYRIVKDLRVLFTRYDQGEITPHGLRDGLREYGLVETAALRELLSRKSLDLTFQEFLTALARVDEKPLSELTASSAHPRFVTSKSLGIFDANRTPASPALSLRGRFEGSAVARDPVSWRENAADNAAPKGLGGPSRGARVNVSEPIAPTTVAVPEAYETTAQLLSSPARNNREPATSAGYYSKDMGLLRQQVHAAIRKLDAGDMDKTAFRRRLTELGITMPPEAERLWNRHSADSDVPFKDWVRSFEPFFVENTRPAPVSDEAPPSPEPSNNNTRLSRALIRPPSNGDVLTWTASPSAATNEESTRPMRRYMPDAARRGDPNLLVPDVAPTVATTSNASAAVDDGRANRRANVRDSTNFKWSEMFVPEQPTHVPLRGSLKHSTTRPPPFSYVGEPVEKVSVTGVSRARGPSRAPFGTEADEKDAFMTFG